MAQMEVYELLKNKRLSGIDAYFSIAKICKMLLELKMRDLIVGSYDNRCISRDVNNLHRIGILEKRKIDGVECFRIRLKVLEE